MNQEDLNNELSRLDRTDLSAEVKNRIKEFVDDIRLAGLSVNRQYFYAIRLRKVSSLIPDSFLKPSEADMKKVLSRLLSGKIGKRVKGHNHSGTYSEWEIENYKSTLKKFYPWHPKEQNPSCISWIKANNYPNRNVKPDNMIIEDEVQKLVGALKIPGTVPSHTPYTIQDTGSASF